MFEKHAHDSSGDTADDMSDLGDVVGSGKTGIEFLSEPEYGDQDQGDRDAFLLAGNRCQKDESKNDTAGAKQQNMRLDQIVNDAGDHGRHQDDDDQFIIVFLFKDRS